MSSETFLVGFNGNQATEFPTLHFVLKKGQRRKEINYFKHFIGS